LTGLTGRSQDVIESIPPAFEERNYDTLLCADVIIPNPAKPELKIED
jgi:hypothetical protein